MIEELPDDITIDDDLDDVEPVGDEAQLYEHFRVVVDRGQEMMRVDNTSSIVWQMLHATAFRNQQKQVL